MKGVINIQINFLRSSPIICLLLLSTFGNSQDLILLKTGEEIRSKVIEITPDFVKYLNFDNQTGPTYSLEKSKVFMITYENGSKEIFKEEESKNKNNSIDDQPLPKSSFNINPLGFLQFGPIFQYETQISNQLYVVPYLRYSYLGLAYHLVWEVESEDKMSPASFGLGIGLKNFSQPTGHTWYYGGFIEYSFTKVNWSVDTSFETEEKASGLAVLGNFGYRWRKSNGSYMNLGAYAGAAFTLKDEELYVDSGDLYGTYNSTIPFAFLEFAFGWSIKK